MSNLIHLTSPSLKVTFDPDRGNIMTSLYAQGKEWIYLDESNYRSEERPRCGCPVLFPYMGSLKDDQLQLDGKSYPAGIHGVVHTNAWKVQQQSQHSAVCYTESNETTAITFPFRFSLTTTITLAQDTLIYHTRIHNLSENEMPCDIGFHPFFQINKLKDTVINIDGKDVIWEDDLYQMVTTTGCLFQNVKKIACEEAGHQLVIELSQHMNHVFLWSGKPDRFIVIEPWTSYVNAINEHQQFFMIEANGYRDVEWKLQII